ncbi:MAG: NlpC/P60 family protein [Peptococcaceae bacterium]|nr:NlpC/P60 family protein [Peptococcaceae bacterium]
MQRFRAMISIFGLTLLLVVGVAPLAKASTSTTILRYGSTGPAVIQLQTELNSIGFSVGKTDGILGSMTLNGVKEFQASVNLSTDGLVGPLTNTALEKVYASKQGDTKVTAILTTAKEYLGTPYRWGGSSPATGFDCSGYTSYVFAQNGISLPRISRDQYSVGTPVSFANLQPGDLVFFSFSGNGVVDHVGIYLGNDEFINASSSKGVTIYQLGPYWQTYFVGGRRVL